MDSLENILEIVYVVSYVVVVFSLANILRSVDMICVIAASFECWIVCLDTC